MSTITVPILSPFPEKLNPQERSDRVIATKWDAAFVLHDGIPTKKDIKRLKENAPKQEVGTVSYKELTLSRANKSLRVFDHVVDSLSLGKQPDKNLLNKVEEIKQNKIFRPPIYYYNFLLRLVPEKMHKE